MFYDYVIIGGGAAGMCTAINLKRNNNSVLIIDKNDRLGKKILSTGNGRCNLTNEFCKVGLFIKNPENIYPYNSCGSRNFIEKVIGKYDAQDTINWFNSIGLLTVNKNGLIYPISEQASAVLDVLRFRVSILGIDVLTDTAVNRITKDKECFIVNGSIKGNRIVLCCGGNAAPKSGSDGSGLKLANKLGHTIVKPLPALCGIKLDGACFKTMQGVRSDAIISVFDENNQVPIIRAKGNVQFNSYGISGIPAMNISGFVARKLEGKNKLIINIEFLPGIDFKDIVESITNTINSIDSASKDYINIDFCINGLLNKKITIAILKEIGLSPNDSINIALQKFSNSKEFAKSKNCAKYLEDLTLEKYFAARVAGIIKHFSAPIIGINTFDDAQTTSGGVSTDEINCDTMESKLVTGLYFAGEIIDVDGICGGYNLQWAWSSAMNVGEKNG